ncbi:hypothetical protein TUM17576_14590 [Enterobacter hormaechei]|nr:hypothetical protein TUM17576_14590 [Enterobacter hormaechei]
MDEKFPKKKRPDVAKFSPLPRLKVSAQSGTSNILRGADVGGNPPITDWDREKDKDRTD